MGHNVTASLEGRMLTKRKYAIPQHKTRGDCHANLCVPVTRPEDFSRTLQSKFSFFKPQFSSPVTILFCKFVSLFLHL